MARITKAELQQKLDKALEELAALRAEREARQPQREVPVQLGFDFANNRITVGETVWIIPDGFTVERGDYISVAGITVAKDNPRFAMKPSAAARLFEMRGLVRQS